MSRPKLTPKPRQRYVNPVDRAAGWELDWTNVAHVFEAFRSIQNPSYVYFIGEEDEGAVKIGSTSDPILRLRELQTGNPRRLRVERVLIGDVTLERLLHELWEDFAIKSKRMQAKTNVDAMGSGTEWFTPDIRERLYPIVDLAGKRQIGFMETRPPGEVISIDDLATRVREAHTEQGFVAKGRDEVRLLGQHGGYVKRRRSRI